MISSRTTIIESNYYRNDENVEGGQIHDTHTHNMQDKERHAFPSLYNQLIIDSSSFDLKYFGMNYPSVYHSTWTAAQNSY